MPFPALLQESWDMHSLDLRLVQALSHLMRVKASKGRPKMGGLCLLLVFKYI
jgi:hypothetical protein